MKRVIAILFLILLASAATLAQGNRNERNWKQGLKEESRYSLPIIVQCYATTNSLSSFVQCLLGNAEQPTRPNWYGLKDYPLRDFENRLDRIERRNLPDENEK